MDEARARLLELCDPAIPAMQTLLGDSAAEPLAAALGADTSAIAGVRSTHVSWHPGRSLAVRYEVRTSGTANRPASQHSLVAWAGPNLPENATIVENDRQHVAVWELPNDPGLPGLSLALDPARVRTLLDDIDAPRGDVRLTLRAYRPARRAVVEVSAPRFSAYIKVVQLASVQPLQTRHRIAAPVLPVPRSHGWSQEFGLVVLEALPGLTLGSALERPTVRLAPVGELAALLERIPDPGDGSRALSVYQAARSYARLIALILPDLNPRLEALSVHFLDEGPEQQLVPVHGDFHEGQLLIRFGHVSGLLDVDTVSMGHRIDDWATLLAHLAARRDGSLQPARIASLGRDLLALGEQQAEPNELRRRIAAATVGLATGPFRVQLPNWPAETRRRVALAERWLASANSSSRERILTRHSGASHAPRRTFAAASRTSTGTGGIAWD